MDYELLDSGSGRRLERFGEYILNRPDPEVMWQKTLPPEDWVNADAEFANDKWVTKTNFPDKWLFEINNLRVNLKLTPFKHVGMFPEQKFEWDLISKLVKDANVEPHILNLFGYTGIASLSALEAGAKVTHVDASRPAITWFKENQDLSVLSEKHARIIIDDALKFTAREIKRGVKYDGVIMDPPVYGHGPNGEKWSFVKDFPKLLDNVSQILTENPLFVIVNAYAISSSSVSLANILNDKLKNLNGNITNGELTLKEKSGGRILSTGIWSIWQR
ncbi:MAG: class I SAM-dependent methyltransferase [Microgenomates group bacterium]